MSKLRWRSKVEDPIGAKPSWFGAYVPMCSESCPHHDGKRCEILGLRAPQHCEPVIDQMGCLLTALEEP